MIDPLVWNCRLHFSRHLLGFRTQFFCNTLFILVCLALSDRSRLLACTDFPISSAMVLSDRSTWIGGIPSCTQCRHIRGISQVGTYQCSKLR